MRRAKGISVEVTLDKARIAELTTASIKALHDTSKFIEKELLASDTIPYRTGKLEKSLKVKASKQGSFNIYHTAPYAQYVHNAGSVNFNRSVNANAQARWLVNFQAAYSSRITDYYAEAFKKRGKV